MVSIAAVLVVVVLVAVSLVIVAGRQLVEANSVKDPTGEYVAVATYRAYQSWIGRAPGDSGGKPGFITIYDRAGRSFGTMSVVMIDHLQDLEWEESGARISTHHEWDFTTRTYSFWNAEQTERTDRKAP